MGELKSSARFFSRNEWNWKETEHSCCASS